MNIYFTGIFHLLKNKMATTAVMNGQGNPKSMQRPKSWSDEVEEAYRFQLAGYRDAVEYTTFQREEVCRKKKRSKL